MAGIMTGNTINYTIAVGSSYSRVAQRIRRRYAGMLDLMAPGAPTRISMQAVFDTLRTQQIDVSDALRTLRQLTLERLLQLDCDGHCALEVVTASMTALAELTLDLAFEESQRTLEGSHGAARTPNGERAQLCIVGMGKLGARELNVSSDIDLIYLFDHDGTTDGDVQGRGRILNQEFFAKQVRAIYALIGETTDHGFVFRVDMRLRPSGKQGPVATQLRSFVDYQREAAETWEHMALSRARCVAGDAGLAAETGAAIRAVLTRERPESLDRDVAEMRRLIAQVKGEADPWDLKLAAGGLIDIEFLAQYLLLRHAGDEPSLIDVSTCVVIETAARIGLIEAGEAETLLRAHRLMTNVTQMLRLTLDAGADPRAASKAVQRRLANAAELPSMSALESDLNETRRKVRAIFNRLLSPA